MRSILAGLALALASIADSQLGQGTFRPTNGEPATWRINEHRSLIWNNAPYLPVGIRIPGTAAAIEAAKAQGIADVVVDLPASGAGWKEALAALELQGMRYLIAIDSLAPGATGYAVEPQSYRIAGIVEKQRIDLAMPGVESVLAVLASRRDSSISVTKRISTPQGRFVMDVDSPSGLEQVLLLYPETTSIGLVDSWEAMDEHRDRLIRALKTSAPGKGFRGILNPLGNMIPQTSERQFVPNSPRFRDELASMLESRYRNVESVQRSWSMSVNDYTTFAELARLVPLWNGARGVEMVWDPLTDKLIPVEAKRSSIWADIKSVTSQAEARRLTRLVAAIRNVCDVPVVQDWVGWLPAYEQPTPALDGLGARTFGSSFLALAESAGRAGSSALRWQRPGWLLGSHLEFAGQEGVGQVGNVIEDLSAMGMRAFFFQTDDPTTRSQIAQEATKRASDGSLSTWSPTPVFFPENALNPAHIQRLPGGRWWFPTPEAGNRIDYGSQYLGYRLHSSTGPAYVLWSRSPVHRVRLRLADAAKAGFVAVDGSDVDPRLSRGRLEITLGPVPVVVTGIDEIPIPQPAVDEAALRFAQLAKEAEKYRIDYSEEEFAFRDAFTGFDRNPGGGFAQMSISLARLNARLARYMWIEGESSKETTFSEIANIAGCSGSGALTLRCTLAGAATEHIARYSFLPRSGEELEVWIAGRIPREYRKDVQLAIGSQQVLRISAEPVSHYGPGFGWYRLGTTRLGGTQAAVQLKVAAQLGTDLAIDAIVFFPGVFEPQGVRQPDAIAFKTTLDKELLAR